MITPRPLQIKNDITYVHRGMAFLESGREVGYMIVLNYLYIQSNGWTENYNAAFVEKSHQCICERLNCSSGVTDNGRSYKYSFTDQYGETVYIE